MILKDWSDQITLEICDSIYCDILSEIVMSHFIYDRFFAMM